MEKLLQAIRVQADVRMSDDTCMRAWEFDWGGETFYIQETGGAVNCLREVEPGSWGYVGEEKKASVIEAFSTVWEGDPLVTS